MLRGTEINPMHLRSLLTALVLLSPVAASARDVALCADLYRQLNGAPQVIGSTRDMRRFAQELSQANGDIRKLRIEMRRAGCGAGSIVTIGNSSDCDQMRQELQTLESAREALAEERSNARQLVRSEERGPILAALRQNSCIPSDLHEQNRAEEQQRMKVPGLALPQEEGYSGITDLRKPQVQQSAASAELPPPPERPYDPNRKLRAVGPAFFPEPGIDLAKPRKDGPQPQQ